MGFNLNFFSSSSSEVKVDLHSHLIPSIDDGAKDMERAIELIKELKSLGYEKLITTPHISDMFPNSSFDIREGHSLLKRALKEKNIEIEVEVAAEYYADEYFEKLLKERDILTFGEKKYLLFELSYFTKPFALESLIFEIQEAGYTPVLAHPERYHYFHHSIKAYEELKANTGVLFQLNLVSISNYYSKEVGEIAKNLIAKGLIDFVGSDTHHKRHTKYLKKSFSTRSYKKIFKKNTILNDTLR